MDRPLLFGKYCLLERISVGGMAEVFRAKPLGAPDPNKYFAVKRILPHLAEDMEFIKMFVDEARLTVQLDHTNIVQTYELGQFQSSHYIVMEFIAGKDLLAFQKLVRRQKSILNIDMGCHIVREIATGIDYAHRKSDEDGNPLGIIHRDISPQNVLVSWDGKVRVIDFGIAKAASQSTRTQAGVLKGKFGYMSPEQVQGLTIDHRSDIFSMGTLLWELLTNQRLFKASNQYETLTLIGDPDVKPPSTINDRIPPQLDAIVMKALTADPDDRYQWASDFASDLHDYLMQQKPPYHRSQLTTWLRSAFHDDFDEEKEKREKFRGINTADDVRRIFDDAHGEGGPDGDEVGDEATQIWDVDIAPDADVDVESYVSEHTVVQAGGLDLSAYEGFADEPDTIDEEQDVVQERIAKVTGTSMEAIKEDMLQEVAEPRYEVEATPVTAATGSLRSRRQGAAAVAEDSTEFPTVEGGALTAIPTPPQGVKANSNTTGPLQAITGSGKQAVADVAKLSSVNRKRIFLASSAVLVVVALFSAAAFVVLDEEEEVEPTEEIEVGRMLVEVDPPTDLEIYVGGEWRGAESPLRLDDLEPGTYRVEIDHPDHIPWDGEVEVSATDIAAVSADLGATGELVLSWEPNPEKKQFYVDGQPVPVEEGASQLDLELARGEYLIEALGSGVRPISVRHVVESDQENELELEWIPIDQLTLTGSDELEVELNGRSQGNLSLTLVGLNRMRLHSLKVGDFETVLGFPEMGHERITAEEFQQFEVREEEDYGSLALEVDGDELWQIFIDGVASGLTAPLEEGKSLPLAAGTRTIGLKRGDERHDYRVHIIEEETTRFRPPLQ